MKGAFKMAIPQLKYVHSTIFFFGSDCFVVAVIYLFSRPERLKLGLHSTSLQNNDNTKQSAAYFIIFANQSC